jgi:hypothetical protein
MIIAVVLMVILLLLHTHITGYKLRYNEDEIAHLVEWGVRRNQDSYLIKPVHIAHDKSITTIHPYEFIHGEYKSGEKVSIDFSKTIS